MVGNLLENGTNQITTCADGGYTYKNESGRCTTTLNPSVTVQRFSMALQGMTGGKLTKINEWLLSYNTGIYSTASRHFSVIEELATNARADIYQYILPLTLQSSCHEQA